jgi:CDGSH-type Zn-finger protein
MNDAVHRPARVVAYDDGPIVVQGDFSLEDADGTVIEHHGSAVALCRCGKSRRKPFCDDTHKLIGRGPRAAD